MKYDEVSRRLLELPDPGVRRLALRTHRHLLVLLRLAPCASSPAVPAGGVFDLLDSLPPIPESQLCFESSRFVRDNPDLECGVPGGLRQINQRNLPGWIRTYWEGAFTALINSLQGPWKTASTRAQFEAYCKAWGFLSEELPAHSRYREVVAAVKGAHAASG